jgi:hypothetical protein
MNREELKTLLDALRIKPTDYSLDNTLDPDRMILYSFYGEWIVFYLNSHGKRTNERKFTSESDACKYLYDQFLGYVEHHKKYAKK